MTVNVMTEDPGHEALRILAKWIAEAYLEELAGERMKELAGKRQETTGAEITIEEEKSNVDQRSVRGNQASQIGKNQAGHKKGK
jgi:hypothetical protein